MLRGILIGVLTLGIAGVAFWGYQEHKEKNAVLEIEENTGWTCKIIHQIWLLLIREETICTRILYQMIASEFRALISFPPLLLPRGTHEYSISLM